MNSQQEAHARAIVSKLERTDLEDKYLRLHEENAILKRHARKQEEKIKKIGTKLMRLVEDRKKHSQGYTGRRTARDVSLEETIESQQDAIRKLSKENELLKQKVMVTKQQLQTQGKRHTPYGHVGSHINSGLPKRTESDKYSSGMRTRPTMDTRSVSAQSPRSPPLPRFGHSLLEEAREENHQMKNTILELQEHIAFMEGKMDEMQEELRLKSADNEENMLKWKQHQNLTQKTTLTENIELIRVQRDMKEKIAELSSIKAKYHELQENYHQFQSSYDKVLHEMGAVKSRLLEEENRNLQMQNELKHGTNQQLTIAELRQNVHDLEREVEILKESNERLSNSAFNSDTEMKWRTLERKLRTQIAQLESAMKHDARDKNDVLDKITNERGLSNRLQNEQKRSQEEASKLRAENRDLRDRVRLLSSLDDAIDMAELEEALGIIRQRRHAEEGKKRPGFLANVDDEKDPETALSELMVQHAETVQELEKTREMLLMQHRINKDYQIEVESVTFKLEDMKREYETKLENYARLLDVRAAKIKKLERQLHDVAYGTKQYKYVPEEVEDDAMDVTRLERGENLMEINLTKVTWSADAFAGMQDREPSAFATYAFYDFELVSTPIVKSTSPRFDFTSQYTVKIDDIFLHHLQKNAMLVELHQAFGTEFKTVAACKIRFNQLLDTKQGKLHGSAVLIGTHDGLNYGNLDFWIRLRVPMDQAIRLYKERTKALGYLSSNSAVIQKQLSDRDDEGVKPDNSNQLHIHIVNCNNVNARREGCQPDIYCVYKFYDFADTDTNIIPSSNSPYFDARRSYPVQMTSFLDTYLKSEKLFIYVLDDSDPDLTSYLGKASVDLIPLAHNKVIRAPFQLIDSSGENNGTIEVSLRWQLDYKQPSNVINMQPTQNERNEMIPEKLEDKSPIQPVPSKPLKQSMVAPKATSTPRGPKTKPVPDQTPDDTITAAMNTQPTPKARTMKSSLKQPNSENVYKKVDKKVTLKVEEDNKELKASMPEKSIEENKTVDKFDMESGEVEEKESEIKEEINEEVDDNESDIIEDIQMDDATDIDEELETDTDSQLIVAPSPTTSQKYKNNDQVRVSINHLAFHPESSAFKNDKIQKVFVEYDLLGETLETPDALPKPKEANKEISYNYSTVVHVDATKNEIQRNNLMRMMMKMGMESDVCFNVVAEPLNEDSGEECIDIGSSKVDILDILSSNNDLMDVDIDVTDEESGELVGRLNVSIEALETLKVLNKEIQELQKEDDQ